jgi:hypothetical protein
VVTKCAGVAPQMLNPDCFGHKWILLYGVHTEKKLWKRKKNKKSSLFDHEIFTYGPVCGCFFCFKNIIVMRWQNYSVPVVKCHGKEIEGDENYYFP